METLNIDNSKYKIMVLDDVKPNVLIISRVLKENGYQVLQYTNSNLALKKIEKEPVDLLLMDYVLNPVSFEDTLKSIREINPSLDVILMVNEFDTAPSYKTIKSLDIQEYWECNQKTDQLLLMIESTIRNIYNRKLIESINSDLKISQKKLEKAYLDSVQTLRYTVELNDTYSKGHSERVSAYSVLIGKELGLSENEIELLRVGGLFHDIGKIGISDDILNKASKLTEEEYTEMKKHPVIGANILSNSSIFDEIIPIVLHHHERYDGSGYPEGLKGKKIPYLARITAVADSFDAMSSKRSYRDALSMDTIRAEFVRYEGKQFDPQVTKVFLKILDEKFDEIKKIKKQHN